MQKLFFYFLFLEILLKINFTAASSDTSYISNPFVTTTPFLPPWKYLKWVKSNWMKMHILIQFAFSLYLLVKTNTSQNQ